MNYYFLNFTDRLIDYVFFSFLNEKKKKEIPLSAIIQMRNALMPLLDGYI